MNQMDDNNFTQAAEFVLLGITDMESLKDVLFVFILTLYLLNVVGNFSIISVVVTKAQLHNPMYFLLANLSFLDICISSVMVPKMLANLLLEKKTISFEGCLSQLHFFHFFGVTEAFLLVSMSYDRYVAICHPLRYIVIMNGRVCILMATCSWIIGFSHSLFQTILTARLPFCASNKVRHFFCDFKPLFKLACANTNVNESLVTIMVGILSSSTFILILISYTFIGSHLLKMKSSQDRQKAFSTCASHIIIVVFFIGTAMCTYARPPTMDSLDQDRVAAILFTVITPTLNPFVYTLRNKEVKRALRKLFFGSKR